jgi:hypothetical protein
MTTLSAANVLQSAVIENYVLDIIMKGKDGRAYDGGLSAEDIIHIAEDGIIYRDPADLVITYVPMSRIDRMEVSKLSYEPADLNSGEPRFVMDFGKLTEEAARKGVL